MGRPGSTFQIDAALRRLAEPQLGLVTLHQIERAGIDHSAITRRRASGALEDVFAGVVRLGAAPVTPLQRILAAVLAVPGSAAAATSAGAVYSLPVVAPIEPIVATGRTRSARTAGILIVRQQIVMPSRPWLAARVSTPESTLVLMPRFETDDTVERCLDHCLAHRLTTAERVRALVTSFPPRAVVGRRQLLELLAARSSGIGHRSRLEQHVAGWLDDEGLTGWRSNLHVPIAGGGTVEVDFGWPDAKFALEVSPFFTHGSRVAQGRDVERRRSLVVEGWRTIEATDPDLAGREAFSRCADIIRAALEQQRSRRSA